jgi:hypothetical protein
MRASVDGIPSIATPFLVFQLKTRMKYRHVGLIRNISQVCEPMQTILSRHSARSHASREPYLNHASMDVFQDAADSRFASLFTACHSTQLGEPSLIG